jgi:hypothetical protein
MLSRGHMIWLLVHPLPKKNVRKTGNFLTGEGGECGGRGAKSYESKNVWSSVNHSILSGCDPRGRMVVVLFNRDIVL